MIKKIQATVSILVGMIEESRFAVPFRVAVDHIWFMYYGIVFSALIGAGVGAGIGGLLGQNVAIPAFLGGVLGIYYLPQFLLYPFYKYARDSVQRSKDYDKSLGTIILPKGQGCTWEDLVEVWKNGVKT